MAVANVRATWHGQPRLHAKHRRRAGFRLAGLRPLVRSVANVFTRNTGVVPVFAWRASARW
jgi:hypothetical protein